MSPAGDGRRDGEPRRSDHMAVRLSRTVRELGGGEDVAAFVGLAHRAAMAPRVRVIEDDHDPDFLHPGRSALVLLLDLGDLRPAVLAAAMSLDSERPELALPVALVREVLGNEVEELVAGVPLPGDEALAEKLVTADDLVRRVALAERLDHLRHAHLWPDPERRRRAHARAVAVYAPVAARTHPALARRYAWWCRMFERRHLG